jgi:hypothetical protein
MKRILILLILLAGLIPLTLAAARSNPEAKISLPTPTPPAPLDKMTDGQLQVKKAVEEAVSAQREEVLAFVLNDVIVDHVKLSQDEAWAATWLELTDPQTGQILPNEPGLALAQRKGDGWAVILPADPSWLDALQSAPDEIIAPGEKQSWLDAFHQDQAQTVSAPLGGYLLPWEGGETVWLSQSVLHDKYTPSKTAHYAFDFYIHDTMFDIYAAKSGTVKSFYDGCENNNHTCFNWIVLEDRSTTPVTYQLYLHLAQNSIPPDLHSVGVPVIQGQFIGVADNTGQSTGHHLHFQVHTNPNSYWGTSVDITFADVPINGGRPRVEYDIPYCLNDSTYHDVCDQFSDSYISGNIVHSDRIAPIGDLFTPQTGISLYGPSLHLEGWATDDKSGLGSAQFIAKYNNTWHDIGEVYTSTLFSSDWDLCADQVPDGPVSLALKIRDIDGNQNLNFPGLRTITKHYTCPPPQTCNPGSNQAALYADPNYGGNCILLGSGVYTTSASLGSLGKDNAASIRVGSNVIATLYSGNNLQGRAEAFTAQDANLADNLIGSDMASSVRIQSLSAPLTPIPAWPANQQVYTGTLYSISLAWQNGGGATSYQARLTQDLTRTLTSTWQSEPTWHLGSLDPGSYTWQVRAKNSYTQSSWSSAQKLKISVSPAPSQTMVTAPYTDTIESGYNGWINSNYWDQTNEDNHTPGGAVSWKYDTNGSPGYDTGAANVGDLTSPYIQIPSEGIYALRFWYLYETEGPENHWDQRWVQISVDDGPFTNTLQLSDDPPDVWLQSPNISLEKYSGHTIRVRFHFETLDELLNGFKGWYLDDFTVTNVSPESCGDTGEPNNTPLQAQVVSYNNPVSAKICPEGDMDFYKFSGTAGDQIGIRTQAQSLGSPLDTHIFLLDSDGTSVLSENDDQIPYQRTDSFLSYKLPRTGDYYIKVRAWNHPSAGGKSYTYNLRIYKDGEDPSGAFISPVSYTILPKAPITLTLSAEDALSGVSHVEFLWHSGDWGNSDWITLGEDWDGQDGWSFPFDASTLSNQVNIAFYARIYDWAGNWTAAGAWNLNKVAHVTYLPTIHK